MVEVLVVVVPFLIAVVPAGVVVVANLSTSSAKSVSNMDILLMYVIFELTKANNPCKLFFQLFTYTLILCKCPNYLNRFSVIFSLIGITPISFHLHSFHILSFPVWSLIYLELILVTPTFFSYDLTPFKTCYQWWLLLASQKSDE